MAIKWSQIAAISDESAIKKHYHVLIVLQESVLGASEKCVFFREISQKLQRTDGKWADLNKTPLSIEAAHGAAISVVNVNSKATVFEQQTLLRKALKPLLDEQPTSLAIVVYADNSVLAETACYVAGVNAQTLPQRKKETKHKPLEEITIYGVSAPIDIARLEAKIAGNTLCRTLTLTPPNELTPALYREQVKALAQTNGWQHEEFDLNALKSMGAGAFVAVAQGSDPQDAAIVHVTYAPKNAKKHIALVGKGICFDTGGHNLKPAKYMQGMHQDMNGSAVALGIMLAATRLQWPVRLDCWLALAQNHIGPHAYKQNDVIKALNGMHIEIVHTDAEGRMVLADTLTLASRAKPEVMLDFATLTGSMQTALGTRMSGIVSNQPELACQAVGAGYASGERVVAFPFAEDYDSELDSDIADIKQCTMDSDADHILAARFLSKFIENDVRWCHVDLSSYAHKDGLGAVASEVNGFGVGWGLALVQQMLTD